MFYYFFHYHHPFSINYVYSYSRADASIASIQASYVFVNFSNNKKLDHIKKGKVLSNPAPKEFTKYDSLFPEVFPMILFFYLPSISTDNLFASFEYSKQLDIPFKLFPKRINLYFARDEARYNRL